MRPVAVRVEISPSLSSSDRTAPGRVGYRWAHTVVGRPKAEESGGRSGPRYSGRVPVSAAAVAGRDEVLVHLAAPAI